MIVNETKLTPDIKIKIKDFQIIRKDRTAHGGGVAILIRNRIPFKKINTDNRISIENVCIQLPTGIYIAAVYNQPRNVFTHDDLHLLANLGNKVLIIGDLNARHYTWKNHIDNINGRTLYNFSIDNNIIIQHTHRPSHFPSNGTTPTYIDLIVNKNVSYINDPISIPELNSDHNPITFEIPNQTKNDDRKCIISYKNTNWDLLRLKLNDKIKINNKIESSDEIDLELNNLTSTIQKTKKEFTAKININPNKIDLNNEILDLIKHRNRVRKYYQEQTHNQQIKTYINQISRTIRSQIRQIINDKWGKTLEEIKPNDRTLWRISKSFRKTNTQIPTLEKNDVTYTTDKEKSNAIGECLQGIQKNDAKSLIEQQVLDKVQTYLSEPVNRNIVKLTNPKEIIGIIKKLPNRKASGIDEIDNKIIKNLPRKAIVQLMYIINAILVTGYYPVKWKAAIVAPIPKPGKDLSNPVNYRPISLLSSLSKVCEKIILRRIVDFSKHNDIMKDEQFGFRAGHSTSLQVARIAHSIISKFNTNSVTSMALLDVEKAFDTVWIDGIIYKLIELKFPRYLIQLINNYLRNRIFMVKINNSYSDIKKSEAGVPQGSVLGPVLFLYFINDIPNFQKTSLAIYADDTSVYAHSFNAQVATKQTQIHINQILEYTSKWKIKINNQKTEHIIFSRKFTNLNVFEPLRVEEIKIKQAEKHVKYLGVILDKRLSFVAHINNLTQKGHKAIRLLYPLLNKNSKLSVKNKRLLYTAVIRPTITYAAPVWCSVSKTAFKKLQRIQNKCLRLILNADRYTRITELHNVTKLETIQEYTTKISKNFYSHHIKNNPLTKNMTDPEQINSLASYKHKFLYHKLSL